MGIDPNTSATEQDALYGDHTRRSFSNTPTARPLNEFPPMVTAYAQVKKACATANAELGTVDGEIAEAISATTDEILSGLHADQFPTALIVGGGGTTTNMNFNEVIANRATQLLAGAVSVHPNDHVNKSQSSNDTFPTAMAIAVMLGAPEVVAAVERLIGALRRKADEYEGVDHLGRTCLNDAVSMPISATHRAQAHALERILRDFEAAIDALGEVPLGGTAIGTGVGAPEGFSRVVVRHLAEHTGLPLRPASDIYDAMSNSDPYTKVASELRRISQVMYKLCADLRFLASGPKGGINEVTLPKLQKGSSIMPGKVNPTIPEVVMAHMILVRGWSYAVDEAVDAGELEINVMAGVMLESIFNIFQSLRECAPLLADRCIDGLVWNTEVLRDKLETGFDASVHRALEVGYEQSSSERGA